jgi:hypothetical protein
MKNKRGWGVVTAVLAVGLVGVGFELETATVLQRQLANQRAEKRDLDRLAQDNARLRAASDLTSPAAADVALAEARADLAALERELAVMHVATDQADLSERFRVGSKIGSSDWKNAGIMTPQATFETVMWAAAGGDVDVLAGCLVFTNETARKAAQALFDGLPPESRVSYGTPEKLIAALSVPDIPTLSVEVRAWSASDSALPTRFVSAAFTAADGSSKESTLSFFRRENTWKLGVSRAVVAKYAAQLKGAPMAAK